MFKLLRKKINSVKDIDNKPLISMEVDYSEIKKEVEKEVLLSVLTTKIKNDLTDLICGEGTVNQTKSAMEYLGSIMFDDFSYETVRERVEEEYPKALVSINNIGHYDNNIGHYEMNYSGVVSSYWCASIKNDVVSEYLCRSMARRIIEETPYENQ